MAKTLAKCPKCGEPIATSKDGTMKLRTRILVFQNGVCIIKCRSCGADIQVPFVSFAPVEGEKLVVLEAST